MATRERPVDRGHRLARSDLLRIGTEIRTARVTVGHSLEAVGQAAGLSASQVGRIERACLATASVDQLARVGAAVGLDIRAGHLPVRSRHAMGPRSLFLSVCESVSTRPFECR